MREFASLLILATLSKHVMVKKANKCCRGSYIFILLYEPSSFKLPQGMCILGCRWMRGWAKSNLSMASLARSGRLHKTATRPGQQALWPCRILIRWADCVSVRVNGLEMVVPLEGVVVKH